MLAFVKNAEPGRITVAQEGNRVVLVINGRAVEIPFKAAKAIGRLMVDKAARAEEFAHAASIASDQAFLLQKGAPFGLTNDPSIMAEALKEARWSKDGIRSQEVLGTPDIIKGKP